MLTQTTLTFGWLTLAELPQVLAIGRRCFAEPWTEEDWRWWLNKGRCIAYVAREGSQVLGFEVHEIHQLRYRIINLCVDPFYHRQGIGTALIQRMRQKLDSKRSVLEVVVHERCVDGQLFLKALGFEYTRTLRGCYEDCEDDTYCFEIEAQGANQ